MQKIESDSRAKTVEIGRTLAGRLRAGDVVAMFGDLGAGKTAFVSGLADGLGYTGDVTSPTFALVHEYLGGRLPLYHFDMYRVRGGDDLYSTGFYDYLDARGVLAIEWSENIESELPKDALRVRISYGAAENSRLIEIEGKTHEDFCG